MTISPYADSTAATVYASITAPAQFAAPARDLVKLVQPTAGMTILDVGTGTGTVAQPIMGVAGKRPRLVGVDPSLEMLRVGRQALAYPMVVGRLPHLSFRDASFDVVTAGFVISHVASYADALTDIARVCRRDGRFGMSAWGSLPNAAARTWTEIASRFVARADLDDGFRAHIPWDGWFAEIGNLEQALKDAQFVAIQLDTRTYRVRMSVKDFLASRAASIQGAILRDRLPPERWVTFKAAVATDFEQRFGAVVEYERDVHFGIGTKR